MAFLKYANSTVIQPGITWNGWDSLRQSESIQDGLIKQAGRVALDQYNPREFLLSHCTIVASVDVENSTEPLGKHMVDGFEVDRRWHDYLITPGTEKWVNHNEDGFERKLLLASFKTFVGADNFCEHLQIPELSKGKIVDAAARDIGDSVYVDILVATHRKHAALIQAIESKKLKTLSMGAQVNHTTCTRCGNVSFDTSQLCVCVRYFKGNHWVDPKGVRRKTSELCGHYTDPTSCRFIEASWVANPAFTGAVLRSILNPDEILNLGRKMSVAFSENPLAFHSSLGMAKAASYALTPEAAQQDTEMFEGQGQSNAPPAPQAPKDPLEDAVDLLSSAIKERAVQKLREQVNQGEADQLRNPNSNDTLIHQASKNPVWRRIAYQLHHRTGKNVKRTRRLLVGMIAYRHGGWPEVYRYGLTGTELLALDRILDFQKSTHRAGAHRIDTLVVKTKGYRSFPTPQLFLAECENQLGRPMTSWERDALIRKADLYHQGSDISGLSPTNPGLPFIARTKATEPEQDHATTANHLEHPSPQDCGRGPPGYCLQNSRPVPDESGPCQQATQTGCVRDW